MGNGVAQVDNIYHELVLFAEREKKKRWRFLAIIVSVVCIISNLLWFWDSKKYEKVTETTTTETVTSTIEAVQDGSGVNIVGGGNVDYGTESQNNNNKN